MTITAWRICKARRRAAAFSGAGARLYGGRWNSPGTPVVYTAGSISLAQLEMLVHLESEDLLRKYVLCPVMFDEALVLPLPADDLPRNWRADPPPRKLQEIGDHWIETGQSAVLRVPSVLVPQEANYLLNPAHPDFRKIKIGSFRSFRFDRRLGRQP